MTIKGLRVLFACALFAVAVGAMFPLVATPAASGTTAVQAEPRPQESPAAKEAEQGGEAHKGGWLAVIAKTVNFAILAGVLVYFLKTPLLGYLDSRITKVREDLVTAAQTREAATRQLAEIEARLGALPAELETLKARGAEEIAAERARIERAAEAERQRLLEHTRREIEMRLRVARRDLVAHAADLAVQIASTRIRRSITPDDQARLIDRYAAQLGGRP
jgi:F-type H+-transporting ATPase subunit b